MKLLNNRLRRSLLLICLPLLLRAQAKLSSAVLVKAEDACAKANEGKRLMIEGYVDFPLGFDINDKSLVLRVRPSLSSWASTVGAVAPVGREPNYVEMPRLNNSTREGYSNRDVRLHLADGQTVTYWNKVKATGTMYFATGLAPGAYSCALKDVRFDLGSGFQPPFPK
jgi:hypothetical protein